MTDPILETLSEAVQGLLYPSETDAPFEAFLWETAENSAVSVARFSGIAAHEPWRALSLLEFLQDLDKEKEFHKLRTTLEKTLAAITVYRFGTLDPVYYIVGKDRAGRLAGLRTRAVET